MFQQRISIEVYGSNDRRKSVSNIEGSFGAMELVRTVHSKTPAFSLSLSLFLKLLINGATQIGNVSE